MDNILLLVAGFILLTGLAMFIYQFTKFTSAECMLLSVAAVIAIQFIAGMFGNVLVGTIFLYVCGFIGIILFFVLKGRAKNVFFSPAFILITLLFLYSVVAFKNILFHNWDEFVQWGKAARFVVENNLLPAGPLFTGDDANPPGTSLMHAFFLRLTGFVEGNAYVSNWVLIWVGFALPIGVLDWKEWKKAALYGAIIFISMYSLYIIPYMSIYVDMPIAAWSGGIVAWWYIRQDKKALLALPIAVMFVLPMVKRSVGPLFVVFALIFMALISFSRYKSKSHGWKDFFRLMKEKKLLLFIIFPLAAVLGIALWWFVLIQNAGAADNVLAGTRHVFDSFFEMLTLSTEKARLTIMSGINSLFGVPYSTRSALQIPLLSFIIFLYVFSIIIKHFITNPIEKKKYNICIHAYIVGTVIYFVILMYTYINMFIVQESIRTASIERYFSIYAVFGFIILLAPLFKTRSYDAAGSIKTMPKKPSAIISLFILAVFMMGINSSFLVFSTSMYKNRIHRYKSRVDINEAARDIQKIVKEDEKVYMIVQNSSGYEVVAANYELGPMIVYRGICFDFPDSSRENKYLYTKFPLEELPKFLLEEGYNYLWVFRSDDYLNQKALQVFNTTFNSGDFYSIGSNSGEVKLTYIKNLCFR